MLSLASRSTELAGGFSGLQHYKQSDTSTPLVPLISSSTLCHSSSDISTSLVWTFAFPTLLKSIFKVHYHYLPGLWPGC